jgi:hypothetical protein
MCSSQMVLCTYIVVNSLLRHDYERLRCGYRPVCRRVNTSDVGSPLARYSLSARVVLAGTANRAAPSSTAPASERPERYETVRAIPRPGPRRARRSAATAAAASVREAVPRKCSARFRSPSDACREVAGELTGDGVPCGICAGAVRSRGGSVRSPGPVLPCAGPALPAAQGFAHSTTAASTSIRLPARLMRQPDSLVGTP